MIGDYPTQLDEIDQWISDSFGILPGACSSTENLRYSVARKVAEALWPNNQSLSDANKRLEEIARKGLENAHTVDFSKQYENSMKILQKAKINLPSDVDLEEEMDKFFETMPVLEHENIFEDTFKNIARHFANWQKEQMLKDAVEATVKRPEGYYQGYVEIIKFVDESFQHEDKVKIVIVKED